MRGRTGQMVVKFSDADVIRDVRHESTVSDRSMAGQIEHWMKIGRAVEAILGATEVNILKESLKELIGRRDSVETVKARITLVLDRMMFSKDRESVKARIKSHGGPVFEVDPTHAGRVVRIMPDGTRSTGRVKDGVFMPAAEKPVKR